MKSKLILGLSFLTFSFSVLAGGGQPAWQPRVSPGQCITQMPAPGVTLTWHDSEACNEVITKGYARAVYVGGLFVYKGGSTESFGVIVGPGKDAKINAPTENYSSVGQSTYQWLK